MIDLKLSELLARNKQLGNSLQLPGYGISILSNIITHQLNPILEYVLREQNIDAICTSGDYDNIVQNSKKNSDSKAIIIFWEASNLIDGFQYKSNLLSNDELNQYIDRFKREIDFTFSNLTNTPLVIINSFSSLIFNHHFIKENNFDLICSELNAYLHQQAKINTVIIDIDKIIAKLSVEKSVDFRNYYSSKALYSIGFYKTYAQFIAPVIFSVEGKTKKALILDCDNTLWNGIIGEDGIDGIQMSGSSPKGVMFEEVQYLVKQLATEGIIIGLNSKNNLTDVDEVIEKHESFSLTNDEIICKKVNWDNKVDNLKNIAKDLNIGIDSLVFVDDSNFEINLINELLPEVSTIQVPKELYAYPSIIRNNLSLFYGKNQTREDLDRLKMYQQANKREVEKIACGSMEEYLSSLNLQLGIYVNDPKYVSRIAQLTQKTNQFNLTTKRYTERDIKSFMESENYKVFACDLKDKFGGFGLTAVAIIKIEEQIAILDTLLMSCRILGRNIELKFIDEILKHLNKSDIHTIHSSYNQTAKNDQVKDFFERVAFEVNEQNLSNKLYSKKIKEYIFHQLEYIQITYA